MQKILEWKEKTELLTLPELSQTIKARDIGRKRNIEHFEVL